MIAEPSFKSRFMTIQPVTTNNIPGIFAPTTQELYTTNKKAGSFVFPFATHQLLLIPSL